MEHFLGLEFEALDARARDLVLLDWYDARDEDGISAAEYLRRIGRGNLASYSRCLIAGEDRRIAPGR